MRRVTSVLRRRVLPPSPIFKRSFTNRAEANERDIRIYLESADMNDWNALLPLGIFSGVNTNPLLLKEAGVEIKEPVFPNLRSLIRSAVDDYKINEIFIQAWGSTKDELVRTGLIARMFDRRVVVSMPVTFEGMQAATELIQKGAKVCMTAGHAQKQAVMGSALMADYFAPCVSGISESGEDAVAQCIAMQQIIAGMGSQTRIMASSLQSADEIVELSKAGVKTFSVSARVAYELVNQPLTTKMTDEFEDISQGLIAESKETWAESKQ
mmetsp:Transcript_23169/g.32390  ORF Transcript_23169/g.32390 Transcript_23169/m.32390 type:complete len:268 (-) Transcript_23169:483-1286(-)